MTKPQEELQKLYERDKKTGAYVIMVALDNYSDVFSEWTPAPFKKRELDPDLLELLDDSLDDIPDNAPVILRFTVPRKVHDVELEQRTHIGLRTYFSFMEHYYDGRIEKLFERVVFSVFSSILFLIIAFLLGRVVPPENLASILVEGMYIGGWVFLWEAFSSLAFKRREIAQSRERFQKLLRAPVEFVYVKG